jgi:ssDNA-specific exonuclease RecJ
MTPPVLLTLKEASKILSIHPETFRRKRARGCFTRLEFHRFGDGPLKVTEESVRREISDSIVPDPLTV